MSDLPKPKLSDEERKDRVRDKARLRKQRYDARMKGIDREGAAGSRKACVLHLSEEAREVLKQNRLSRRLLDRDPVLDSELVDALLLAHRQQQLPLLPNVTLDFGNGAETLRLDKVVDRHAKLIKQNKFLKDRLLKARIVIADAEEEAKRDAEEEERYRDTDWSEVEDELLARHRLEMPFEGLRLLANVRQVLNQSKTDGEACRNLAYELTDYICHLIDRVPRRST